MKQRYIASLSKICPPQTHSHRHTWFLCSMHIHKSRWRHTHTQCTIHLQKHTFHVQIYTYTFVNTRHTHVYCIHVNIIHTYTHIDSHAHTHVLTQIQTRRGKKHKGIKEGPRGCECQNRKWVQIHAFRQPHEYLGFTIPASSTSPPSNRSSTISTHTSDGFRTPDTRIKGYTTQSCAVRVTHSYT